MVFVTWYSFRVQHRCHTLTINNNAHETWFRLNHRDLEDPALISVSLNILKAATG